ncbi:MAG TPA: DNA-binding response regulator [Gammaproteobacteria bacterium]|nr:DNA-binding response regulator [Gammaproteobacteria bacterium]
MIRVLLVDDHKLFRLCLRRMLETNKGLTIVGEAADGESGVAAARELRPDIILMDLLMPGVGGLEAIRRIGQLELPCRTIVLSACEEQPFPMQALKAGAAGYLTKGVSPEELQNAIRRVFLGKRYLSTDIAQTLAVNAWEEREAGPFDALSNRELQIMMMVANCHKVSDISSSLHLSPKTVNSYRYRIFEKLNVSSDVELALLAARYGMTGYGSVVMPPAMSAQSGSQRG